MQPEEKLDNKLIEDARQDMALQDLLRNSLLNGNDSIDEEFDKLINDTLGFEATHRIGMRLKFLRYRVSKHLVELSTYQVKVSLLEQENRKLRNKIAGLAKNLAP
jgi:hypothetical protein